jgi:serine/threonine-protein kinase
MARRDVGRDNKYDSVGEESYPHPLVSCLMPIIAIMALVSLMLIAFSRWIATEPRDVTVPPVEGLKQEFAEQELTRVGLVANVITPGQVSETVPEGAVISVEPPVGRRVKVGRSISLIISAGSGFTTVPDVRELPVEVARQRLTLAKLQVGTEVLVNHPTIPYDRVIDILPKPGDKLKLNSTVTLTLSKGPLQPVIIAAPETHSGEITVKLPTDVAGPAELRIDVTDNDGKRTVLEEQRNPGETVKDTIQGTGEMTVEVFFDNKMILTKKL